MKVELHIDELVLHGLPPGDGLPPGGRRALADSLTRELSRLLTEGGLPETWRRDAAMPQAPPQVLPHAQGTPMRLPASASAARLGAALARSIHGGLNPIEPGEV